MTVDQPDRDSRIDQVPNSVLDDGSLFAAVTTQTCLATLVLIATFLAMWRIVESGRTLQPRGLLEFLRAVVVGIPFLTNIAAAQRTRHNPKLSSLLMFLTCLGCVWHIVFFGGFTIQVLTQGTSQMHGMAGAMEFMALFAHLVVAAMFILFSIIADRHPGRRLFLEKLRNDILTSHPKRTGVLYAGTVALLCLCACMASRRFLKPELSASFSESFSISALSSDSRILAVGSAFRNDRTGGRGSTLMLLNSETMQPIVSPLQLPQCVQELEFVSSQFGFTAVLMEDKHVASLTQPSTMNPSLVQVRLDGTVRTINTVLPPNVCGLAVSPNGEVVAVGGLDETTHEATATFVRLADGVEISSFPVAYVPSFEIRFLADSSCALLLTDASAWKRRSKRTCSLIALEDKVIDRLFDIDDVGQDDHTSVVDSNSRVYDFVSEGKLIHVWSNSGQWHYVIAGRVPSANRPFGFHCLAAGRIVTAYSYSGSLEGSTVQFLEGSPLRLMKKRIESDGPLFDMELSADGTRLFVVHGSGISVYQFPQS